MQKINQNLKASLLEIGFSDKEANVYLSLLELGRGTVSSIARAAGIQRTTCYNILDSLVSKELAKISGKKPKQEYIALSPDKIIGLLKNKAEEYTKQLKKAEKLSPQLKSLHNIENRPQIKFYEGKEGLIEVYEDTLTSKETIKAYATVDDMHNTLPNYFPKYYKRRAGKGIAIKAIIPKTAIGMERSKQDKKEKRTTAFIDPKKYYFSPEINIYDNKIMIASWREKLGIIIESAEIADAMKKIYQLAWKGAQKMKK